MIKNEVIGLKATNELNLLRLANLTNGCSGFFNMKMHSKSVLRCGRTWNMDIMQIWFIHANMRWANESEIGLEKSDLAIANEWRTIICHGKFNLTSSSTSWQLLLIKPSNQINQNNLNKNSSEVANIHVKCVQNFQDQALNITECVKCDPLHLTNFTF